MGFWKSRRAALVALALAATMGTAALAGLAAAQQPPAQKKPPPGKQKQPPGQTRQAPPGKVTICHRTGSNRNPGETITISRSALPGHLRHGDTLGACGTGGGAGMGTAGAGGGILGGAGGVGGAGGFTG